MKKNYTNKRFFGFIVILTMIFLAPGAKAYADSYEPEVRAFIKKDGEKNWVETLEDIRVGEIFFIRFDVLIKNNRWVFSHFWDDKIKFFISFPATEIMECSVAKGQGKRAPVAIVDRINGMSIFPFTWKASRKPKKFTIFFRCKALNAGNYEFKLNFDDNVNDDYDHYYGITYR